MRLISQALLVLAACLRTLASRPSKDLILPHASLPEVNIRMYDYSSIVCLTASFTLRWWLCLNHM